MNLIIATSQSSLTVFNVVVPLVAALIGGGFALLGTLIQGKITEKHADKSRRRDLSIESARKVDIQLVELQRLVFDQGYYDAHGFDNAAYEKIALICIDMELHGRYIDDNDLQESITEATKFLRPYGEFEELTGDTITGVVRNIALWLKPMIQAHITGDELPQEPAFVDTYRTAYKQAKDKWE